jgi:hypothetical protein
MINVECAVCGQVIVISNPEAIRNAEKGIRITCDACSGIQPDDYVRGFHNEKEVACE